MRVRAGGRAVQGAVQGALWYGAVRGEGWEGWRAFGGVTWRTMLARSARAEVEAMAQQEPQYTGMCWLRVLDR